MLGGSLLADSSAVGKPVLCDACRWLPGCFRIRNESRICFQSHFVIAPMGMGLYAQQVQQQSGCSHAVPGDWTGCAHTPTSSTAIHVQSSCNSSLSCSSALPGDSTGCARTPTLCLHHRHSHFNDQSEDEDQDCCRICRGSASPLYYPCKCSGSIKYVHQQCLMDWLGHSGNTHCEVSACFGPTATARLPSPRSYATHTVSCSRPDADCGMVWLAVLHMCAGEYQRCAAGPALRA